MHELAIAQSILHIVEEEARRNQARRVIHIKIKAGELRGIVPQSLNLCFEFVSQGTLAQGAKLEIERLPLLGKCRDCQETFPLQGLAFQCSRCNSQEIDLIQGMELLVSEIEVE